MTHLAEQSVLDFVNGALATSALPGVHRHLDDCQECRAVVAAVIRADATDPGLDDGALGSPEPTRDELPRTRRVAPEPSAGIDVDRPLRVAPHTSPPARMVVDEYELGELLGRGGMGSVYRARDAMLARDVAIKLMMRTTSADAHRRFLGEARAVARIDHPNVVVVHRAGIARDQPYIVYALVRGRTLDELPRPLAWPKALELAVGLVRGLAAAHAVNVLHRDIKPANVMLDDHGDVVLVDFGLAKVAGAIEAIADAAAEQDRSDALTAAGVALGTPRYMAPESWRGEPATPPTDLFSFGLVVYELLAGRLPFADTPIDQIARRVCNEDAPPLAELAPWVPGSLCSLVDRCLAREPARRPASAEAIVRELESVQRGRAFEELERDRVRRLPPGNPYPGARPFGWEHQGVFFGRHRELRELVDQLRARQLVVVAGEPGAGKTSLCRAGVLPIVARGALAGARKWVPIMIAPGRHPVATLAEAIAPHVELAVAEVERRLRAGDSADVIARLRAGHRGSCTAHVLFVDQLEDLVTIADRDEAERFAAVLAELATPVGPVSKLKVLATVRAASMFAVAALPGLSVICPAIYLVLEPRDEAVLREIVVEPARLAGRAIDDATVRALVAAGLPLAELATRLAAAWPALPPA